MKYVIGIIWSLALFALEMYRNPKRTKGVALVLLTCYLVAVILLVHELSLAQMIWPMLGVSCAAIIRFLYLRSETKKDSLR